MAGFVLKGDICWAKDRQHLSTVGNGYLVCEDGVCRGAFENLPAE